MAKTLTGVITEVLYRLGDSTSAIWSRTEIARYLNEGYERLAMGTGLLWDTTYLEDQSYAGNYTTIWETTYFPVEWLILNRFHYTADWEAEYAFPGQVHLGPANHTTLWEFDNGYHPKSHFLAIHQIPAEVIEIERAVWNKRRIEPLRSRELEFADGQYQTQQGELLGYLRDKDGIRSFRKWRIPSSAADEYTVTGSWGLLRAPTDISAETVIGSWGVARRIPGEHPANGDGIRGIPRRVYQAVKNTKIEYTKKGKPLVEDADEFEVPDLYVKYIRHFAMYRAFERDGNGQDLSMAGFWKTLWESGMLRAMRRKQAIMKSRTHILGGQLVESRRPPLARLPWAYGRVVR